MAHQVGIVIYENVALYAMLGFMAVIGIICVTVLLVFLMMQRRRSSLEGVSSAHVGDEAGSAVGQRPHIAIGRARGDCCIDASDSLSCRHIDMNGKVCAVALPQSGNERVRIFNAARQAASALLHVDFCRDSCTECL